MVTGGPVHGISVEDPCLFTYGGRWYYFIATISNPDKSVGHQNLDNKNLELFEYVNEINVLCPYGQIIYHDLDGSISRFFNRMDNKIEIVCTQMKKVQEGKVEMFYPAGRGNGEDTFAHSFIVQNFGILHREKQNITYQISLISTLWYCLCSQITFSNYLTLATETAEKEVKNGFLVGLDRFFRRLLNKASKNKQPAEFPTNGFEILETILSKALAARKDVSVNTISFNEAAKNSTIKIPLITNGNDNVFTLIPYVFDRLYYHNAQMEPSLKFLVYDVIGSAYKCIDYNNPTQWNPCTKPNIILSMFETDYEQELFSVNNQLAAVVGKKETNVYEDFFEHKIWKYDPTLNDFNGVDLSIQTKTLTTLANNRADTFKKDTEDKYQLELRPDHFPYKDRYNTQMSLWSNDYSIYQSILDNLTKRDALIVNTEGDITHQPGCCMAVVLDRTITKSGDMTPEQLKELREKHRQIEQLFPVLKVQHRYSLMTRPGKDASYTENVVLGRNFVLPVPK